MKKDTFKHFLSKNMAILHNIHFLVVYYYTILQNCRFMDMSNFKACEIYGTILKYE